MLGNPPLWNRDPSFETTFTFKPLFIFFLVDGGFTAWSAYTKCSSTCGGGTQERTRSCTNPEPAHGGKECVGPTTDTRQCGEDPCPG